MGVGKGKGKARQKRFDMKLGVQFRERYGEEEDYVGLRSVDPSADGQSFEVAYIPAAATGLELGAWTTGEIPEEDRLRSLLRRFVGRFFYLGYGHGV